MRCVHTPPSVRHTAMAADGAWEGGGVERYALWDIDGTLLKNGAKAGSLYDIAVADVTGFVADTASPGEHGKTDGQIIAERLAQYGLDPAHHSAVGARLDELSTEANLGPNRRELTAGVPEALAAVAAAGWTNALLTGNSPTRARVKLVGAGLSEADFDWDMSFFGQTALRRSDITAAARVGLAGLTSVVIGDTPSDGSAADAAGIPFIAVATGVFDRSVLEATSARVVLDDLVSGLSGLLDELKRIGSEA